MNYLLRTTAIAAALLLSAAAAGARGNAFSYSRTSNARIGITAANEAALGGRYQVLDENGRIVLQGRIKDRNTFYIPTSRLTNGSYTFLVEGYSLQQFSVND